METDIQREIHAETETGSELEAETHEDSQKSQGKSGETAETARQGSSSNPEICL